jgi:DNA-binding MarR family transcriptional regulator
MAEKMEAPVRVGPGHERRYRGADRLATEVMINLLRAEGLASAELNRRFRTYGLSTATFNVLMILEGAAEPLCPWQIGERLLVTRGTVTGLLDSLERAGLINRTPHPDDRRMLLIELTDAGRDLLNTVWAEHFPAEAEMAASLSEREKETLVRLLGKLQAHLLERSETAG